MGKNSYYNIVSFVSDCDSLNNKNISTIIIWFWKRENYTNYNKSWQNIINKYY